MAIGKNKQKQGKRQNTSQTTKFNQGGTTNSAFVSETKRLTSAANEKITDADLKASEAVPPAVTGTTAVDLKELIAQGNQALALLNAQRQRLQHEEEQAQKKLANLGEKELAIRSQLEEVKRDASKLEEKNRNLKDEEKRLSTLEQELLEREELLLQRETDADAGFIQRNREALKRLADEADHLRKEIADHRLRIAEEYTQHTARIIDERAKWEQERLTRQADFQVELDSRKAAFDKTIEQERARLSAEIEAKTVALTTKETEHEAAAKRLRQEARTIDVERELLAEDRSAFEERVERHAAAKLEQRDAHIAALNERLAAARQERDELERKIAAREEATRQFGDRSPESILAELRTLSHQLETLKKERDARPAPEMLQRLGELERQREGWEIERIQLLAEVSELKQDVVHKRIAVTELEALRNHKAALEASNDLLQAALQEEIRKINDQVRGPNDQTPFPSCSKMDSDSTMQSVQPTTDVIPSLHVFSQYVRHCIAFNPKTQQKLYYSEADIRSFIAGLSMSRLHLLHGISGTGKTSLPINFARAIGAGEKVIEVQAGWRDRQDLIGHFNTFEHRFYESEFLQALYQASCPFFRNRLFIIVLDEMNLSHPEQYFADILSAIELEQDKQRLVLMTASVDSAPRLLVEESRKLRIPPNVWFVGTANQDETTKDFADKTYDRAHVMELPRQPEKFDIKPVQLKHPISLAVLQAAFDKAKQQHAQAAQQSYTFLEEHLGDIFKDRFGVGWGNRLEQQMKRYVPVVIECGGNQPGLLGEATDHIIATKLLRKVKDRHDTQPEDISALRDQIRDKWSLLDRHSEPKKSLEILAIELRRLGRDED